MAVFSNQATLTYRGGTTNSNVVTGEILDVLSASKASTGTTYRAGDIITYVLTLVNTGSTALTGITISDDLGAYPFGVPATTLTPLDYVADSLLYYTDGALQPTPTVNAGPPLTVSGITVPAGGDATIIYRALVNAFAPIGTGGSIINTATVSGGTVTEVTASTTVTAEDVAVLTISKALSPTTVVENGTLTYTFVVSNSGNTEVIATDDAVIADTFDPILTGITVTLNGTPLTEGTDYTYNEATGAFATTAGTITVPAATIIQDETGAYTTTPGTTTLIVSGTV